MYKFPVQQITKEVDVAMGITHELMAAKATDAECLERMNANRKYY